MHYVGQNLSYSCHRLSWTKPVPGIGDVGQNLFLAYIMLDKTCPIPGIGCAEQNLKWDSFVKICKTECFPSKKIISKIKY